MGRRYTTQYFIKKAKEKHEDRYGYSKVKYVGSQTNVIITCYEHGDFLQPPASHIRGYGCPTCGGNLKYSTEIFIEKARKVHGNRYDYSLTKFTKTSEKVIIICPIHGKWEQIPNNHLRGAGCPYCLGRFKTTESFIIEAKKIHNNRYGYSKVIYVNSQTKVIITCPEHGEWEQVPSSHLSGRGCPICAGKGLTYQTYVEVKKIIKPFNMKNHDEYFKWWNENKDFCREMGIPYQPDRYYKTHR